jgi:hypothetical protein
MLPKVSNYAIELLSYIKNNSMKMQKVCIINEQLFSQEKYKTEIEGKCIPYHSSVL